MKRPKEERSKGEKKDWIKRKKKGKKKEKKRKERKESKGDMNTKRNSKFRQK